MAYKTLPIPIMHTLVHTLKSSAYNSGQFGVINMIAHKEQDDTGQTALQLQNRPGIRVLDTVNKPGFGWSVDIDGLYGHIGTKVYYNFITDVGIAAAAQESVFIDHQYNGVVYKTFSDGVNIWALSGATPTAITGLGGIVPNPYMVSMDGYLFFAGTGTTDNDIIYNTDIGAFSVTPAVNKIRSSVYPGNIVALTKHNNVILSFKETGIEFFYDAALVNTSPLQRQNNTGIQIGCSSARSIAADENQTIWLGTGAAGELAFWLMEGFNPRKISTPAIEQRILEVFGDNGVLLPNKFSASNTFGQLVRLAEKTMYLFFSSNLFNGASRGTVTNDTYLALAYDLDLNVWYEFKFTDTEDTTNLCYFRPFGVAITFSGTYYYSNANVAAIDQAFFSTSSSVDIDIGPITHRFSTRINLPHLEFETPNRKIIRALWTNAVGTTYTLFKTYLEDKPSPTSLAVTRTRANISYPEKEYQLGQYYQPRISLEIKPDTRFTISKIYLEILEGKN